MVLTPDFIEFVKSLNSRGVRYLVIGGYAVALHGYPRYTKDLDVWIEPSESNAVRMVAAMDDFGFASLGLKKSDFLEHGQIIQLGYPPNRIDILTTPSGVEFEDCFRSRVEVTMDDVQVNFINLENLRRNKRSTGRHQDLADLENLEP